MRESVREYDDELNRQIGLYLSLEYLFRRVEEKGVNLEPIKNQHSGLISSVQSTIFILKYLRLDLGYVFNWRSTGPYSTKLEKDSYYILINGGLKETGRIFEESKKYTLSPEGETVIERYIKLIEKKRSLLKPEYLNLVASLLFIWEYSIHKHTRDKNDASELITRYTLAEKPKDEIFKKVIGFTDEIKEIRTLFPI